MVRRTTVAVVAAVIVVVGAGATIALVAGRGGGSPSAAGPLLTDSPSSAPTASSSTTSAPSSTTAPPSSALATAGSMTRGTGTTTSPAPSPSGPPGSSTSPVASTNVLVTYAGWDRATEQVQVNAFMPVLEKGGTCSLTIADAAGAHQRTATAPASADATTTICDQLTIDSTTMKAGTWTAVVTYSSPIHQGRSAASDVVVTR